MSTTDDQSDRDAAGNPPDRRLTITVSGCSEDLISEVRRATRKALRAGGCRTGQIDIAVVGEAEMRRQHAHWKGGDGSTDVLAFDLGNGSSGERIDGQLLVCAGVARRRARTRKTDWHGELLLYVVHGCLHLCGYDDRRAEEAALMHCREDEILASLGWGPVFSGTTGPATGSAKRRTGAEPARRGRCFARRTRA
jgi:probable rRNA maturation factor